MITNQIDKLKSFVAFLLLQIKQNKNDQNI